MTKNKPGTFCVLMLIASPKLSKSADTLFRNAGLPVLYRLRAEGTASSEMMDMLGLESRDKLIYISMIPRQFSDIILHKLWKECKLGESNTGIAFTIPVTGISAMMTRMKWGITDEAISKITEKEHEMNTEARYVLVTAVVNRGFSTDVMEAAKKAGASGGTVVNGRRIGNEEVQSFWGITVQDEKDLVLILTEADNKVNLMREISQSCGMHSDAKGIVTAIPVDSLAGLGYAQRENE